MRAPIPIEDLRRLEALEDHLDVEAAKLVDQDINKHGTVCWEQAKGQLDLLADTH